MTDALMQNCWSRVHCLGPLGALEPIVSGPGGQKRPGSKPGQSPPQMSTLQSARNLGMARVEIRNA